MSVWKFAFDVTDHVLVRMPLGATVLHVGVQRDMPCIWALVDTSNAQMEKRHFRLYGTGHDVDRGDIGPHVGSFQMHGGSLVFHLFEAVN